MIKLKNVKMAHAIKVGRSEEQYLTDSSYEIFLINDLILKVTPIHHGGETTYTSIMNAVYWKVNDIQPSSEETEPVLMRETEEDLRSQDEVNASSEKRVRARPKD